MTSVVSVHTTLTKTCIFPDNNYSFKRDLIGQHRSCDLLLHQLRRLFWFSVYRVYYSDREFNKDFKEWDVDTHL